MAFLEGFIGTLPKDIIFFEKEKTSKNSVQRPDEEPHSLGQETVTRGSLERPRTRAKAAMASEVPALSPGPSPPIKTQPPG